MNSTAVEVEKPESDARIYGYHELSNGARALLISDPTTETAKCAVVVGCGSLACPRDLPGLPHFLEHMLFLSSKKYPQEGDLDSFLAANGGEISNAWTALKHTVYYLSVNSVKLEEAMDRLTQFFVAPMFAASGVKREMNAVHSEFTQYANDDCRRFEHAITSAANPDHPLTIFSCGNLETLRDVPNKMGINTHERVQQFWRDHYSSDDMNIVVNSNKSIEEMRRLLSLFDPVRKLPPQRLSTESSSASPATPAITQKAKISVFRQGEDIPTFIKIIPVSNSNTLRLRWIIPGLEKQWRSKPGSVLTSVLGHESRNSLLSVLKKRGLAVELAAGCADEFDGEDVDDVNILGLTLTLTDKGNSNVHYVIAIIEQYLHKLRLNGGVPDWFVKEHADITNMAFRFLPASSDAGHFAQIAARMRFYPPEQAFSGSYRIFDPDTNAVNSILQHLHRDNLIIVHATPDYAKDKANNPSNWNVEHFHKYDYQRITPFREEMTLPADDPFIAAPFHFLDRNPYVSSDFSLREPDPEAKSSVPIRVDDVKRDSLDTNLFYIGNNKFRQPWAAARFKISTKQTCSPDVRMKMLVDLTLDTITEMMNEDLYMAESAHLSFDKSHIALGADSTAFELSFSGFSDKLPLLMQRVFQGLKDARQLDQDAFDRAKEARRTSLDALMHATRLMPHCQSLQSRAMARPSFAYADALKAVESIDFSEAQQLTQSGDLWSVVCIDALISGNVSRTEAIQWIHAVNKVFGVPTGEAARLREQALISVGGMGTPPAKLRLRVKEPTPNSCEPNSAILCSVLLGKYNHEDGAKASLLSQILDEVAFKNLRTRQQLGYTVRFLATRYLHQMVLSLFIQSAKTHDDELQNRADGFLEEAMMHLAKYLDSACFETYRNSIISRLQEPPKNLAEEQAKYWRMIADRVYAMDAIETRIELLQSLSRQDFINWVQKLTSRPMLVSHIQSTCMQVPAGDGGGYVEDDEAEDTASSTEEGIDKAGSIMIITPLAPSTPFGWTNSNPQAVYDVLRAF